MPIPLKTYFDEENKILFLKTYKFRISPPFCKLPFIHFFELDISIKFSAVRPEQQASAEQHNLSDELEQTYPPGVSHRVIHIRRFQRPYPEGIKCE